MEKIETGKVTWIHIEKPTAKEVEILREAYGFHPLILEQLLNPTLRPKVEEYDKYLYMVLHFPVFEPTRKVTVGREIDFLILKQTLITIVYESLPPVEELFGKCTNQILCQQVFMSKSAGQLLYYLLRELYLFSLRQLDHIKERIDHLEEEIYRSETKDLVREISVVRRDILDFRRTVKPQQTTLESLIERGQELWGKNAKPYLNDINGEYLKMWNLLENHKETIEALHEAHESMITSRTNEIMKLLTIFAVITFPLTLFASILGMNTTTLPLTGFKGDFWIVLGIMLTGMIGMFTFFKKKKWL